MTDLEVDPETGLPVNPALAASLPANAGLSPKRLYDTTASSTGRVVRA